MNKIILIFPLFFLNNSLFSSEVLDNKEFEKFLIVLGKIESNNDPKAYNRAENAIGIFQIRKLYFKDAQFFDKTLLKYAHCDCFDPEISKKVVKSYISRYCRNGSLEDWFRLHNSGPNFRNKKNLTDKYWKKALDAGR